MYLILFSIFLLVVVAPVWFWLWFFRSQDRAEPEPKKLLTKVFLGGIPVVVFAAYAEQFVETTFFPAVSEKIEQSGGFLDIASATSYEIFAFLAIFFLAGPVEELMKYLVLKAIVYKKIAFNQIADGVIYGIAIALSFSLIENTFYFFGIFGETDLSFEFVFTVVVRGILTTMLHLVATAIIGLNMGRAKFSPSEKRRGLLIKGVVIASLVHGLFNVFLLLPFGLLFDLVLVVASLMFVLRSMKTVQARTVWRLVTPKETQENN